MLSSKKSCKPRCIRFAEGLDYKDGIAKVAALNFRTLNKIPMHKP